MTVLEFKILGMRTEVRGHFTVMNKGWKFVLTKKFGSKLIFTNIPVRSVMRRHICMCFLIILLTTILIYILVIINSLQLIEILAGSLCFYSAQSAIYPLGVLIWIFINSLFLQKTKWSNRFIGTDVWSITESLYATFILNYTCYLQKQWVLLLTKFIFISLWCEVWICVVLSFGSVCLANFF